MPFKWGFSAGVEWAKQNHQRAASMTATNQASTGEINYNEVAPRTEGGTKNDGRPALTGTAVCVTQEGIPT